MPPATLTVFWPSTRPGCWIWKLYYSRDWRHPDDELATFRHKSQKCAEFLVPDRLPPKFIEGAYVVSMAAKRSLVETGFAPPLTIDPDMFFH